MPANFAMPVAVPSTAGDDAGGPPEAGLAARVAAGPGLWEDEEWLADLRRESLLESLLATGRSPRRPGRSTITSWSGR